MLAAMKALTRWTTLYTAAGVVVLSAWHLALSRPPRKAETQLAKKFLSTGTLPDFCLALFNRNEFVYVP